MAASQYDSDEFESPSPLPSPSTRPQPSEPPSEPLQLPVGAHTSTANTSTKGTSFTSPVLSLRSLGHPGHERIMMFQSPDDILAVPEPKAELDAELAQPPPAQPPPAQPAMATAAADAGEKQSKSAVSSASNSLRGHGPPLQEHPHNVDTGADIRGMPLRPPPAAQAPCVRGRRGARRRYVERTESMDHTVPVASAAAESDGGGVAGSAAVLQQLAETMARVLSVGGGGSGGDSGGNGHEDDGDSGDDDARTFSAITAGDVDVGVEAAFVEPATQQWARAVAAPDRRTRQAASPQGSCPSGRLAHTKRSVTCDTNDDSDHEYNVCADALGGGDWREDVFREEFARFVRHIGTVGRARDNDDWAGCSLHRGGGAMGRGMGMNMGLTQPERRESGKLDGLQMQAALGEAVCDMFRDPRVVQALRRATIRKLRESRSVSAAASAPARSAARRRRRR